MVTRTYQLAVTFAASGTANVNVIRKGHIVGISLSHTTNSAATAASVVELSLVPSQQGGVNDAQGILAHSELQVATGDPYACSNFTRSGFAYPVEQGQKIYIFGNGHSSNSGVAVAIVDVAE